MYGGGNMCVYRVLLGHVNERDFFGSPGHR
jgi:hypothetical protein